MAVSVTNPVPVTDSTVIVKHRVLTGLAVAPLTFAALGASGGPVDAASGVRATTLPAQGGGVAARDTPLLATTATDPAKRTSDSVGVLAGGMVAAASAAFAGTGVVRKPKMRP